MATCDPRDIYPQGITANNMLPPISNIPIAGPGLVLTSGGWTTPVIQLSPEYEQLLGRVHEIEKRLSILRPDPALLDKYTSLQEAYESYKIIERLVYEKP